MDAIRTQPLAEHEALSVIDETILSAIAKLFVAQHGEWPFPRDVALALGSPFGLSARLESLLRRGRVAYHCTGGSRRVVLLLTPDKAGWQDNVGELNGLMRWLLTVREIRPGSIFFPSDRRWWNDWYAAYVACQEDFNAENAEARR